jgi:ABC-type phosphate transport system substrate-binding protein
MKRIHIYFITLTALVVAFPIAASAQVAVIANKDFGPSSLDETTVKNLYNLVVNDVGGNKVKLFDMSNDTPSKQKFFAMIGKASTDMRKVWLKAKLTGNGTPPEAAASEDDMLAKVSSTPGGIGYVPKSKVGGNVKVLMLIE